jgi:hypothetical protein
MHALVFYLQMQQSTFLKYDRGSWEAIFQGGELTEAEHSLGQAKLGKINSPLLLL